MPEVRSRRISQNAKSVAEKFIQQRGTAWTAIIPNWKAMRLRKRQENSRLPVNGSNIVLEEFRTMISKLGRITAESCPAHKIFERKISRIKVSFTFIKRFQYREY